ncbi:phosphate ABC transporter permease PstA [Spongisporangium articulatum]|uniref:Phosphate transport system permease protein PstA n=1 Tax=Spongisporangium articulatum TaxID=3362603 RepID=A0ABW8ALU2_9ACTN
MSTTLEPTAPTADEAPIAPSSIRGIKNVAATVLIWASFVVAMIPLVWILYTVLDRGLSTILKPEWWQESQNGMTIRREGGGAYHAILGTLEQALTCAVISVPIGVLTAVYLVEYGRGRLARTVNFMVDILTGVPSIVAALFVYAVWVTTLHLDRVGFAVSLSLVLLMIPVIVRSTEEMLKLVPNELREASYALGVPTWKTILRIVLPTALSGIITGVLLGLARVMGETAPLLILVGYSKAINSDLFSGFQGALPTMINAERTEVTDAAIHRTWGAALTLILLVLLLNILGRFIAGRTRVRS